MKFFIFFVLIFLNLVTTDLDKTDPCDPEQFAFATEIFPIIEKKCLFCHNDAKTDGDVNLKDYQHILPYAEKGRLLGSIKFEEGFFPMPPFGEPLSECELAKIQNWIKRGAKE